MSEHFTRNTESVRCWCPQCAEMTEHPVSNGHIQRCPNDHSSRASLAQRNEGRDGRPRGLPRAAIPQFNVDDRDPHVIEVRPGAIAAGKQAISMTDRLAIQALEGPDYPHDGHGNLPEKGKGVRRRYK